ncbi:MAG: hypothetical protein M3519_06200 [Actinomycetota bacterium]|nr:hypothetical protein [Actinomycetota bacterium]
MDVHLASGQAHDVKDTLVAAFGPANLARLVHHLLSQQRAARLRVLSAGQGVVDPTACLHPHTSGAARPEDDTPARGLPRHNRKEQS